MDANVRASAPEFWSGCFMDRTRLLRNAVFATVALTLACQPLFSLSAEAAPTDFGRKRLDVIAFGADNTGMSDSTGAIQAALNSCDATAGCEVYFPPGAYEVTQTTLGTPLLQTPSGVPITLAGAGQLASVIEAMPGAFPSVTSDVIAVGGLNWVDSARSGGFSVSAAARGLWSNGRCRLSPHQRQFHKLYEHYSNGRIRHFPVRRRVGHVHGGSEVIRSVDQFAVRQSLLHASRRRSF